jgi:hypothetical protein
MPPEVSANGATPLDTEEARCAKHAEAPAVGICPRCGTFLCAACGVPFENAVLCSPCFERNTREPRASSQAWASLYLGLGGLVFGFVPGLVGLVLAYRELERIRLGESPPGGRALARAGQLLGWLNAVLLLLVSMVLVSRLPE